MREFATVITASIICLLGMGAGYEAEAAPVSISSITEFDFTDGPSTTVSGSNNDPCIAQTQCTQSSGIENGPFTHGTGNGLVSLNEQVIGIASESPLVQLLPAMTASSSLSAKAAPADAGFAPGVGVGVTNQVQIPFAVTVLNGGDTVPSLPDQELIGGALKWSNTFTNFSGGASTIQFTFSVSGQGISDTALLDLACVSVGCSVTFKSDGVDYFGPFQSPSFNVLLNLGNEWNDTIPLTLSDTVVVSAFTGLAPSTNGFSFNDPMTLTYLDANGNVVPNLVFYNSDLNAIMPLSGQEFTPVSLPTPAPEPASLPMFAGGIGALGLLTWRRKRKVRATA